MLQCFPKPIDNSKQEVALSAVTAHMPQRLSSTIAPHPLTSHMDVRLEWERKKRQNIYQGDCEHSRQVTHSIGSSPSPKRLQGCSLVQNLYCSGNSSSPLWCSAILSLISSCDYIVHAHGTDWKCSHGVAAVGPPKPISSRWLGQRAASWLSAPNHDLVLAVDTFQGPLVPSGGSHMWITDMICFASRMGMAGLGAGGHAQPCADVEGLPHGSQAPRNPDPSVDTPPHGVGGHCLHEDWVFLVLSRSFLGSFKCIRENRIKLIFRRPRILISFLQWYSRASD